MITDEFGSEEYERAVKDLELNFENGFLSDKRGNKWHNTCIFGPNVNMGSNNYFGPYCVIGMPGEVSDKFPNDGAVLIGDNNVFAGMLTVDASVNNEHTKISHNCFLMKQTHVGHDCFIFNGVRVSPGARIGGECMIFDYCNIGMNAAIHQRVKVPIGCMIGMGAVITKKTVLRPWQKYAGVPAKCIGSNEAFKK